MQTLFVSTAAVAIAEIGDKTQLLSLILAAKYRRPWPIVIGIFVATLANHALAGAAGAVVAEWFSPQTLRWIVAASFFAVALWTQKESVGKATHIGLTAPMATYDLARLDWPTPDRAYAEFANLGQFACETCCCADFAVSLAFPRLGVLDRHLDQLLPAAAVRSAALV